jgi:LuxR family transcriptional regulator, maltose regulon positive regulatory protein
VSESGSDNVSAHNYHHLFAEVLSAHLRTDQPDQVAALHRRASQWYELHDSAADAIRHALAAADFARAADLVELACPAMSRSRQEGTLLGWMKALPDEVLRCRPVLSAEYAGVMLSCGLVEGVADRLRDAEAPPAEMVVVDEETFRHLPGIIAMYRAGHSLALGNLPATSYFARQVLDLVPEEDHLRRGAAVALLGLAAWTSGDLKEGHRMFAEGMARLQKAGNISDAVGGLNALADIRIAQGELRQVMRTCERGLQLATEHGELAIRGTADMYVGMGELCCEWNNLHGATQHLLKSKEQGEHTGFPQYPHRWRVAMARIRVAEGDLDAALDLLEEAERLYVSNMFPNVRPIAALKARVWVAQGRLGEALGWAREQGLNAHDQLSYLREFEHITLARVLLA